MKKLIFMVLIHSSLIAEVCDQCDEVKDFLYEKMKECDAELEYMTFFGEINSIRYHILLGETEAYGRISMLYEDPDDLLTEEPLDLPHK